jgi:hypothetical protein
VVLCVRDEKEAATAVFFFLQGISIACMHIYCDRRLNNGSDYIEEFLKSLKKVVALRSNCGNINEPLIRSVNTIHTEFSDEFGADCSEKKN